MTPHPGNHILPHYDLALNNIQTRVNCVCESLLDHMAVLEHVISDADMNGANGIIADDELLDEETRQILSLCSAVLIQFHPLGSDLRLVLSLSRCTDKLRECAEEVADIARHAKASIKRQESLAPDIVLPLLNMAVSEFRDAVESLKTQDMETAREVRLRDKKLDKAHRKALGGLVTPEAEDQQSLNVNLLFIIRSIERIGDIAKTIAAAVVFLKEATDIRHGRDK